MAPSAVGRADGRRLAAAAAAAASPAAASVTTTAVRPQVATPCIGATAIRGAATVGLRALLKGGALRRAASGAVDSRFGKHLSDYRKRASRVANNDNKAIVGGARVATEPALNEAKALAKAAVGGRQPALGRQRRWRQHGE